MSYPYGAPGGYPPQPGYPPAQPGYGQPGAPYPPQGQVFSFNLKFVLIIFHKTVVLENVSL